jgi:glucose-6-phosphate isomerase
MKLRRNSLSPLRLDIARVLGNLNHSQRLVWDDILQKLAKLRDVMLSSEGELGMENFITLPGALLNEYESNRRQSVLGSIFRQSTGLHARVDRVVVLGPDRVHAGVKAIMDACCQPYWNELSRAERGSKPRMHFLGNHFDNDAIQSLLHLMDAHKKKLAQSEIDRWALVAIDSEIADVIPITFQHLFEALTVSLNGDSKAVLEHLVPVVRRESKLNATMVNLGMEGLAVVPNGISDAFSLFSVAGLVPIALLGVNVIELLQGADFMTKQFQEASPHENLVLQYVAALQVTRKEGLNHIRSLDLGSQALAGFGAWHDQLVALSLAHANSRAFCLPSSLMGSPEHLANSWISNLACKVGSPNSLILNRVLVDEFRFDPLVAWGTEQTIPEALREAAIASEEQFANMSCPIMNLYMRRSDELNMGQLTQLFMLATELESLFQRDCCST